MKRRPRQMTPSADRFARLREAWANVMNTDLDDAAGDARMIVETVPSLLAALDAAEQERDRLKLKNEQYQRQLDDRWAGVVTLTNNAIAENKRLLTALDAAEALATAVEQMGITENEIERYRFRQDAFDSARAFRAAMEAK